MANQVAYGFNNLKDVFEKRVTEVGVNVISKAISDTLAEHNRQVDALIGLFVRRLEPGQFKTRYRTPVLARLQPLDDNGRARPIRLAGYYEVMFPIQMAGGAWGANFIAKETMTVGEANEHVLTLTNADLRWVRDHILAALFANASWTYTDELENHGTLTINGLANADTVQYLLMTGADNGATDSHYLAQAAAIADGTNPFPTIYQELKEHPDNGGEVIVLVPTNLKSSVEGLASFNPISDPNLRRGSGNDELIGSLGIAVPGEIFGYLDSKVWVAEWRSMPDNYLIATCTDGERPLGLREPVVDSLRGFRQVAERTDYPFWEAQYIRMAGFGAWNRVGAVVQRIGNASYAIPTNYTNPMP